MQEELRKALNRLRLAIASFRGEGKWEGKISGCTINLDTQWGIDLCPWPRCDAHVYQNFWILSDPIRGTLHVNEMMLHYAEAGHWISYSDIPLKEQELLITLLSGKR